MNKFSRFAAVLAAFLAATPAFAQTPVAPPTGVTAEPKADAVVVPPAAPPVIVVPAAPAVATNGLPEGCERVAFTTTLIEPNRQEVHYTFSGVGSDVAAMKACNPEGKTDVFAVTPSSVAGSRVSIKTKNGNASIGLPATFVAGEIRQRVCGIKDGEITFAIFELAWQDGLPKALRPTDVTQAANIDRSANVAACIATIPVDRRAELKKK